MKNRHVYVRPAREGEADTYFSWAVENADKNEFDKEVARFPTSTTWCAYDKDGPLAYQTIQRPFMLESIAPRPGATKFQTAQALGELTKNAISQASIVGAGEIYFLGSDAPTSDFATNQVFEKLPFSIYRLKIKDLSSCA